MKKHYFKLTAIIITFVLFSSISGTKIVTKADDTVKLTIFHINDTHGRMGAEAYLSQMVKERKANGENVLVFDAGDRLHGLVAANLSRGESVVNTMNAVGYDAMVVGNHDFNFGLDRLLELSEMMNFPLLSFNISDQSGNLIFQPEVTTFDFDGLRVGVFGLTTPETKTAANPDFIGDLVFHPPIEAAKQAVAMLEQLGCDIIIAITHLGEEEDDFEDSSDALAGVKGINIIIDGHSHTQFENGRNVNDTLIVQTGGHANNIGIIEIAYGDKITKTAHLIPINDELVADETVLSKIAAEDDKVEPIISQPVSHTPVHLNGEREAVRGGETNLANLITDSMRFATGADIAILSGGNIRASIEAGDITMGHILTTMPFSNLLVTVEMSGADIWAALEHGISDYPDVDAGKNIQVSGLMVQFDPEAEPGSRIKNVKMADRKTLDLNATYTVATIEFLAAGGDGYTMFEKGENLRYYGGDAQAFATYLQTNPVIKADAEGRMSYYQETSMIGGYIALLVFLGIVLFPTKVFKKKQE